MTAVAEIVVGSPIDPWLAIGLTISDDVASIGGIALRFESIGDGSQAGITAWTLQGSPSTIAVIDGLRTRYTDEIVATPPVEHPLGVVSFDHLVVMTSSLERTCGAIESSTGAPLKRIREAGAVRQGFHRIGPLIVEVVETADVRGNTAAFWGFVIVVDDIHATADRLGPDVLAPPKAAVQAGRLIASFRQEARLGFPVALMSR